MVAVSELTVTNVFLEANMALNSLKIGSSSYPGVLITNPVSVLLFHFLAADQTVTNVFLEANMAPSGLKLASYSNFGLLITNLASVLIPDCSIAHLSFIERQNVLRVYVTATRSLPHPW